MLIIHPPPHPFLWDMDSLGIWASEGDSLPILLTEGCGEESHFPSGRSWTLRSFVWASSLLGLNLGGKYVAVAAVGSWHFVRDKMWNNGSSILSLWFLPNTQ